MTSPDIVVLTEPFGELMPPLRRPRVALSELQRRIARSLRLSEEQLAERLQDGASGAGLAPRVVVAERPTSEPIAEPDALSIRARKWARQLLVPESDLRARMWPGR